MSSAPATAARDPEQEQYRMLLLHMLHEHYAHGTRGTGRVMNNFRYWRKKYAWMLIIGGTKLLKRTVDVVVAGLALILLLPLFLIVAAIIKAIDRGPILFWQMRVGRWGHEFPFPKFRSMVTNAEEIKRRMLAVDKLPQAEREKMLAQSDLDPVSRKILLAMKNDHRQRFDAALGAFFAERNHQTTPEELQTLLQGLNQSVPLDKLREYFEVDGRTVKVEQLKEFLTLTFKQKDDPRVTRIGRIIRKLSIDELPQLWCVLKGDMSLVGPRPPVPSEVARYTLADRRRLDVIPGLTCIWQVSGRGNIPFPQQVQMDVNYIENQGFWFDIKLMFKTIPAVLSGKGAF